MAGSEELVVTVPVELVRKFKGLAIDMGGSAAKFVYRSKLDEEELSSGELKYGHLHAICFSKTDQIFALDYVRAWAQITRDGDLPPALYTTGIGCSQHGKLICERLAIKLEQLTEFDCFCTSFFYLASRLPRTELLEPFLDDATAEPRESTKSFLAAMKQSHESNMTQGFSYDFQELDLGFEKAVGRPSHDALGAGDVSLAEAEPDSFPCVLAMAGSAFGFFKIEKDGSFKVADNSNRGGKSFMAIGHFLTGAEDYDEFMELAAAGVLRNVDQFTDQLVDETDLAEGDDSLYSRAKDLKPSLIFCFGQALGKELDELRREDLARAWLNYVVLDLVQCAQYACLPGDVKRLFFCGGFCSHPLVRQLITTELVRRNLTRFMFTQVPGTQFDFVKGGAYLGALGCAINDVEKFIGK